MPAVVVHDMVSKPVVAASKRGLAGSDRSIIRAVAPRRSSITRIASNKRAHFDWLGALCCVVIRAAQR